MNCLIAFRACSFFILFDRMVLADGSGVGKFNFTEYVILLFSSTRGSSTEGIASITLLVLRDGAARVYSSVKRAMALDLLPFVNSFLTVILSSGSVTLDGV